MSLCTISAASPSTLKEQRRKKADPKFTWLGGVRVSLGLELKILGTPLHTTSGFCTTMGGLVGFLWHHVDQNINHHCEPGGG